MANQFIGAQGMPGKMPLNPMQIGTGFSMMQYQFPMSADSLGGAAASQQLLSSQQRPLQRKEMNPRIQ